MIMEKARATAYWLADPDAKLPELTARAASELRAVIGT